MIFIDPPYFNSFNQEYYGINGVKVHPDGRIMDGTELFIELLEYLRTAAATIVVISNSCAVVDYIFESFIKSRYPKTYAHHFKIDGKMVRKSTNHTLLVGGAVPEARSLEQAIAEPTSG